VIEVIVILVLIAVVFGLVWAFAMELLGR